MSWMISTLNFSPLPSKSLMASSGRTSSRTNGRLAVRLQRDLEALLQEAAAQQRRLGLQHRLAAGDGHEARGERLEREEDLLDGQLLAALPGVGGVAVAAAAVAAGQAHEGAGAAGVCRLALDALEDLADPHRQGM
jgi:hypothetical protein